MSSVAARLEARAAASAEGDKKADNFTLTSLNHLSASSFLTRFDEEKKRIENELSRVSAKKEANVKAGTDDAASIEALKAELSESVTTRLQSLSSLANEHSHLLTAYDVRATKLTLQNLEEARIKLEEVIQPKSKFSFRKKTKPAASATAAAADAASISVANDVAPVAASAEATAAAAASSVSGFLADLPPEDPKTGFYHQTGQVLIKCGGSVTDVDVMLSHLRDCVVFILDRPSAVRCHNLTNCHVYVGPCGGSTLIYGSRHCSFHLSTKQLRIHDTHDSTFQLTAISEPIIEHTDTTGFGPADFSYPNLAEHLRLSGFEGKPSLDSQVKDFNWLRAHQSPNWYRINESETKRKPVSLNAEQIGSFVDMTNDKPLSQEKQAELRQLAQQLGIIS